MPIVWVAPDGSLRIMTLEAGFLARERQPDEAIEDAVLRLAMSHVKPKMVAAEPAFAASTPILVRSSAIPADRSRRYAWRLQGQAVVVDPNVLPRTP